MNYRDPYRERDENRDPVPPKDSNGGFKKRLLIGAAIAIAMLFLYALLTDSGPESQRMGREAFARLVEKGNITITSREYDSVGIAYFEGFTADGTKVTASMHRTDPQHERIVNVSDVLAKERRTGGGIWGVLLGFLPMILFGGILWYVAQGQRKNMRDTLGLGKSRAHTRQGKLPDVIFDDVAGVEEAKEDLREVVQFLKSPLRFFQLGARIPTGVLLVGPPGTGKTLMARAVAGEAGVPFFSMSGSEFVEMFVGVGASRVRDLFNQARRNIPCIVFIDEIDAVGRHRGAGLGGGSDEREQTLNQILVEMDGFSQESKGINKHSDLTNSNAVIVIAATNRPDILDPALLRPGRFDRRVTLDLPDVIGRQQILEVHAKGKPLADDVDMAVLARQTIGFSGADLANMVNEAAILAARKGLQEIEHSEFADSIDRVLMGAERKNKVVSPKEKEMTAYHEAGHTLVAHLVLEADPPYKVSIVPRGQSGGHTRSLPAEDRTLWTKKQFEARLAMALGGRVAEELVFNETTTGASDDLQQATALARAMIMRYGMSEKLGLRTFGKREEMVFLGKEISEQRDYGDDVTRAIDEEISAFLGSARETAERLLKEHLEDLKRLAKRLIEKETLEGEELQSVLTNG